jgi:uncharacterized protein
VSNVLPDQNVMPAENRLARASSSYLRSASHQPVHWQEWGEEAFARAARENKPVLLDIGAVWCHWCHVMDRESYENPETAAIINDNFVAVKVDRDERPDVDTRYQIAVQAISGQGGWPLTAFLTADGRPYFGGTYFPPEDRTGRAGFPRVLLTMAGAYADHRGEVEETAAGVMEALQLNEMPGEAGGELPPTLLTTMVEACMAPFDSRHGGFGSQPKFLHSTALDLLLDAATRGGEQAAEARRVATHTLRRMAAGGIHDQLAGGFHRYSVDERWIVPHFEKMAYDNSELLKNYVHAFQSFAEPEFSQTARGIVRWMDEWLTDRDRGGFYASQDADISLEDDGDYFTWTRAEARAVLSEEEFRAAALRFNLRDIGDMHHNPQKNVLHLGASVPDIAKQLALTEEQARALLASATEKMYTARLKRPAPFVDKTIYVGWNGMCISAYLEAARVLQMPSARDFALRSLDRVLAEAWEPDEGLRRVVAYGESPARAQSPSVEAVLDDYAFLATACLDAWESTGELVYFSAAEDVTAMLLMRFYDREHGGFFDRRHPKENTKLLGVLGTQRKPVQDAPTPAGNAVAIRLLTRLFELTQRGPLLDTALKTLQCFAGVAGQLGLYGASYALSLRSIRESAVQVCIVGDDALAQEMAFATSARFAVNKRVIQLKRGQLSEETLPPALLHLLQLPEIRSTFAVVCSWNTCQPPVTSVEELLKTLARTL